MQRLLLALCSCCLILGVSGCEGGGCDEGDCDEGFFCSPDTDECEPDCLASGCEGELVCNPESHECQDSCVAAGCGDGTHCNATTGVCDLDCTEGSCGEEELCNLETGACELTVVFDDASLEACVREYLGLPEGPILPSAIADRTHLECPDMGIEDITGLEHFVGLVHLTLWENGIVDISLLEGLTSLEYLQLGNNQIVDLSPLSGMTALRALGLSDNQIEDLSPLSGLTGLSWLNLDNNLIDDLEPIEGLSELRWLTLEGNRVVNRTWLLDLAAAGIDVYSREVDAPAGPDRRPTPDRDLGIGMDRAAMQPARRATPNFTTDDEGVVTFEFELGETFHDARHVYEGDILFDGSRFSYRQDGVERVIGEISDGEVSLCSGAFEHVCDFSLGQRLPGQGGARVPDLEGVHLEPIFTVSLALRPLELRVYEPPANADHGYGEYHALLDPFVLASPNQLDAGSCLYMSNTGAMEILLNQHTPLDQIEYQGETDLSERYLMNADSYVSNAETPYSITDLVYTYNALGGALLNRDYPFTAGYVRDTATGRVPSDSASPDAYFTLNYNWIDELPAGWQDSLTETPEVERTVIFTDPVRTEESVWNVGLMNADIVERIKFELRTKRAPVIVVYNHYLYWHADIVVGYDDARSIGECPMVRDSLDYFAEQGARTYVSRMEARMEEEGGCYEQGIFYIRDSIYDGTSEELIYDYSDRYRFTEPYSERIRPITYDWVRFLANHTYSIHRR